MRTLSLLALTLPLALTSCGKTTVEGADAPNGKGELALTDRATGCIQGVVINGLTGERIALPESVDDAGKGVSVRLNGTLVFGDSVAVDYAANPLMKGEYTICDVPLEETYPLYAQVDGFLPFGSLVSVTSSVPQRSGKADADIQKPLPTSIVNIRLYPVGTQTKDLKIRVLYQTGPLANATVQLVPSDKNVLDQGNFAAPTNGALMTLTATTDATGVATFPAGNLVLGGVYDYTVIPEGGSHTFHKAEGLVIGLLAGKAQHDAYFVQVDLDNTAPALKVVSQSDEPNAGGEKRCTFNRPVKLAYASKDKIAATLSGAVDATMKPQVANNDSSESVNVQITDGGYTIVLSPIFEKAPDMAKEPTIAVTFSGVTLMPADRPELQERLDLATQCTLTVNLQ